MHVAVFHIPVFRFRSVHRTDGAEHTGDSAALQDLILSLAVSAAFLRNPDFRPSIRFFTKHCPVRAGPVF